MRLGLWLVILGFLLVLTDSLLHQSNYVSGGPKKLSTAIELFKETSLVFAGVRFQDPISRQLNELRIYEPSTIQSQAILPLSIGMSCILHSETGSGKTLCYLLPLLKRLMSTCSNENKFSVTGCSSLQAMIVVPSRELAIQVAADVASLMSVDKDNIDTRMIHLCIDSNKSGLDEVQAPIVIGTPFKLLDAVRASSKETLRTVNFLVLDEVDRMLQVPGKYVGYEARRQLRINRLPIEDLITRMVNICGFVPPRNDGISHPELGSSMQVIAASATIGRPLRRHLYHLLTNDGQRLQNNVGELPLLRSEIELGVENGQQIDHVETRKEKEIRTRQILDGSFTTRTTAADSDNELQFKTQKRRVCIPSNIRHVAILMNDETDALSTKISAIQRMWTRPPMSASKRGIIFVSRAEDVKPTTGMLGFMGLSGEVRDLQNELGISLSPKPGKKRYVPSRGETETWRVQKGFKNLPVAKLSTREMISRAVRNNLGVMSRFEEVREENMKGEECRELFVIPVSGTRGLHIKDVEYVLLTSVPRTMNEYLHVAGRTGRVGNSVPGTVITLVNHEELKRLQSWQISLNIKFDVEYDKM